MKKILFTAIFFFFFLFPSLVYADDHFSLSNDITYTVKDDAMTHVVIKTDLTNKTSDYYASENGIRIGFSTIENVKAYDSNGSITPQVVKDEKGYAISVTFNKPVVGINKTLPFTIEFDTPDIVQKQGSIYELDIPGLSNQDDYAKFDVHVRVPSYFGDPQYIKPDVGRKTLDFTKEDLHTGGISIAFGENQVYTFSLKYHIANTHLFPIHTEIALPPNTNYQDVSIESIEPKPLTVKKDLDGNWLAEYALLPSREEAILVKGKVKVHLFPKEQKESKKTLSMYLRPQKYWEVDNAQIQSLAKELKTPKAIYAYVSKKLSYDFSRISEKKQRVGAAGVLQKLNSAVCLEFTDLFIAIARAAGIPAREIDGFGYTQNAVARPISLDEDILHAWPEYYDTEKNTWIMVDPTWGNTTGGVDYFDVFDFSHITFVIKGADSAYPVPAGGYKLDTSKQKDVIIVPTSDTSFPLPHAMAELIVNKRNFSTIPVSGLIQVSNPGGVVYPSSEILINSSNMMPLEQTLLIPELLPFSTTAIPFTFDKTTLFTTKHDTITALIGESKIKETITIVPLYFILFEKPYIIWFIGGGVIFASITIIIFILTRRSRNLPIS